MPSSFGLRPRMITMEPAPNPPPHPARLGVNRAGYRGERIDAASLLKEIRFLANRHRFTEHVSLAGAHELVFLSRLGRPGPRCYLSAGIHGDEPAGLVALRDLIRDNAWPDDLNLGICPCLNPQGCELGTRENAAGLDLNRDYRAPGPPRCNCILSGWPRSRPGTCRSACTKTGSRTASTCTN